MKELNTKKKMNPDQVCKLEVRGAVNLQVIIA